MHGVFLVLLSLTSLAISTPYRGPGRHDTRSSDLQSQAALGSTISGAHLSPDVEKRTLDQIYQAALKEYGTLKVAWGGDVQNSKKGIAKAFTTRFPGIKIDIDLDVSKYLDGVIDLEYQNSGGKSNGADVAVVQAIHNFPRWKEQGRLLPYKVAPWDDIYPDYVDKDGAYTGLHIFTLGYQVYNPQTISNTSLPKTYPEYLRPEWKDKLIITYPNDDDAVLYLFKLITEKYGIDYIHSLQKNGVRWVRGTATPSILIGNTAGNKTTVNQVSQNIHSISFASSSAFAGGIATHDPEDIQMSWPQTGAIFSTTQMPETAKLFMSFIMDDKWQKIVSQSKFATRRTYDGAKIMEQPFMSKPTRYVEFMNDRQQVEEWRLQVEKMVGTPQGQNPVEVW